MERVNRRVTTCLAVLALLLWGQGWWNGARPLGAWYNSDMSHVAYPRTMATVLTVCACMGWVMMNLAEACSWGQPRCRKCRYVLRGLTEPRCPECGTPL